MLKTILKEFMKWLIITIIVGFVTWIAVSIYKTIRQKIRGS